MRDEPRRPDRPVSPAWNDEAHVADNRRLYREKFDALVPMLQPVMHAPRPEAGFYLWARIPGGDDEAFARALFEETHVTVLPGQYLARDAHGTNPDAATCAWRSCRRWTDCIEAAERIVAFSHSYATGYDSRTRIADRRSL
jgi:N-succinyldiaminopimelate aminotransferase